MTVNYDHLTIETKWRKQWTEQKLHNTNTDNPSKEKYYNLVMFPYPSGANLHVGHWYNYGGTDIHGRYMRLQGYDVFQPMGFDSFGLPAENYAIKTGTPPAESTAANIEKMVEQLSNIGAMWDWDHTLTTSSPEYYKWTQWMFLKFYEKGLAYKKNAPVNWCPSCQTVLANEQAQDGTCERCKSSVERKDLDQWFFKITDYADRLLDHSKIDWPEKTKLMQTNWIGKSEGINYIEKIKDTDIQFKVFDSVPQTFMAQSFAVIAADHPLLPEIVKGTDHEAEVMKVAERIIEDKRVKGNEFDAMEDMDGVFTGRYIEDPFGTGDLPLWVASFAIADYGSGIVNCSAHDERDFAFAKKFNIPLNPVMFPADAEEAEKVRNLEYCYHHADDGVLESPAEFKGRKWGEVREDILNYLEEKGWGERTTNYRLRDWLLSRQRYWGAPIPIVYDPEGKAHPVPEEHLPWVLPTDVDYNPKGASPLATSEELKKRTEQIFGTGWTPEVDTMDTFVCSSWYFLRYPSANDENDAFNIERTNNWMPVDMYIGGPEHACMHLLYARFFNMVMHDLGYVKHEEPFKKLVHQGLITKDGSKMSKSKGNVVSPDEFVDKFGSDVFRMYLMFMGPYTDGGDWSDSGITGIVRFRDKLWNLLHMDQEPVDPEVFETKLHQTIKKVGEDIKNFQFNTAIAALMEFTNYASKTGMTESAKEDICTLIAPLAPHFAEEVWQNLLGMEDSIFESSWPEFDPEKVVENTVTIAVQVNGKLRADFDIARDTDKDDVLNAAKAIENVAKYLEEGELVKEIYVPNKLVNLVVKG
jgi:leucyl-tRNA synthetase